MQKQLSKPITPAQRKRQGVCARCFKFVTTERLVAVRGSWICLPCGEAEIRSWNDNVNNSLGGLSNGSEEGQGRGAAVDGLPVL